MSTKSGKQNKRRTTASAEVASMRPEERVQADAPVTPKRVATPSSPEPPERREFSTPTRSRKLAPQVVTPKEKNTATPRATENDAGIGNVTVSPSLLIRKGEFGKRGKKPSASLDSKVHRVYKLINKSTGALGGNGYDGAIYGELTMHSMQKVGRTFSKNCL